MVFNYLVSNILELRQKLSMTSKPGTTAASECGMRWWKFASITTMLP